MRKLEKVLANNVDKQFAEQKSGGISASHRTFLFVSGKVTLDPFCWRIVVGIHIIRIIRSGGE
jgi:hypothetical protein